MSNMILKIIRTAIGLPFALMGMVLMMPMALLVYGFLILSVIITDGRLDVGDRRHIKVIVKSIVFIPYDFLKDIWGKK